jgi:iron(III) transport system permease protein
MRTRTLSIELLLLAFFGVFLIYPLVYVIPGSASDEDYAVRLDGLGATDATRSQVSAELAKMQGRPVENGMPVRLHGIVKAFPEQRDAEMWVDRLRKAGAEATLVRRRNWTDFYFREALGFRVARMDAFPFVRVVPNSPFLWECLRNSLLLAAVTTLLTTLVCLPLARWFSRYEFRGRGFLSALLLLPLIFPPFVGAIGLERLLGRFGTLNLLLIQAGLCRPSAPIDWLGAGGLVGVVLMQVLHLYPILYLNLAAAWANVDPTLEDAARNLGASENQVFRSVTFPLLLPGYFAGASLVFIWAFTDLGTPLVFNFQAVIPVQIFDQVSDPRRANAVAYALVVVTLLLTAALFYTARWLVGRRSFIGGGKGAVAAAPLVPGPRHTLLIYGTVVGLTVLAALPNVGVVLTAVAERWSFTPLPTAYTTAYLEEVWSNKVPALSLRNSVSYSLASTVLDVVLGVVLAWLVVRRPSWLTGVLDGLAMVPLALPGLVLAFGYLTCYSTWRLGGLGTFLDPTQNPALLLIVAYTVRRLPYLTRSAQAGLQQVPPLLEEAAENLGASRWRVVRTVTLPLIGANLLAGAILTFAFALLEVSDSLMLAREEKYFPITRAILGLLMRPDNGDNLACALAVVGMVLLCLSLLAASLMLGRRMGQLFRAYG